MISVANAVVSFIYFVLCMVFILLLLCGVVIFAVSGDFNLPTIDDALVSMARQLRRRTESALDK